MMEPEARYVVVGVAVLALFALIAAVIVWLLSSGNAKEVRHYTLAFAHQSLEGLEVNSQVRMKGIRVGSVTSFAFSGRSPGGVEVNVDVDAAAPVRESTRAVVDRNLVTGLATIQLVTTDENSPLLHVAAADKQPVVIPEGESQMQQFSQTMSQLAQRADETMQRIGATLSPANQAAIGETLANLRTASREANVVEARLDTTLASIVRSADALQGSMAVATGDFHRLVDRYDDFGARAGSSLGDATTAIRALSADVSSLTIRTEDALGDADVEVQRTGPRLRSAADALGATSTRLADPRSLLFGPNPASLGPGEAVR
jgi:phospholipid/cholesterol/gamma-HCH transport system substrate-binding protein